jgi:phospho-N-acetylmuramoyl-pentapeptide-transferase
MIYHLLYEWFYLALGGSASESYFVKALNVFQYVTFRTAYAAITSLLISLLFGGRVIAYLRRLKVGQQIRAEGPQTHQAKQGTPTMGGALIIGSVLISTLLWAKLSNLYVWIAVLATASFALIGFFDDYAKIKRQQSLGLTGKQKLAAQLLVALCVWGTLFATNHTDLFADYSWNLSIRFSNKRRSQA